MSQFVADGHIGLGSMLARFDAMGGAMDINSQKGHGTQVTVTSPPEPVTDRRWHHGHGHLPARTGYCGAAKPRAMTSR